MAIDYDKLTNWKFDEIEQTYTFKDSILYALGVGVSMDPLDMDQLRFTYEEDLLAQIHKTLPAEGTVIGTTKITEIIDKGEGKGALMYSTREIHDKSSGDHLATLTSTTFCRGDGGFGGPKIEAPKPHTLPERDADSVVELATLAQAALIYRLSGDFNPLHADPRVATAAGFKAPILHGLSTLGVAGHAILKQACGYDPAKIKSFNLRFTSPVYPGETIVTEMWHDGNVTSFRCKVKERDLVVLNNGYAEIG